MKLLSLRREMLAAEHPISISSLVRIPLCAGKEQWCLVLFRPKESYSGDSRKLGRVLFFFFFELAHLAHLK